MVFQKKKFIVILTIFTLQLFPLNFLQAITQNQIDAEVQIVCTDGNDNWFSGSGTIIDPKGIILTNKHVVDGAYEDTCYIGFIESINKEPNFGVAGNYNLAEVKYRTSSNDMDAAVLYLYNPSNKNYPYVDIWSSNSDNLSFGDKIEAIGYPGIGGSTITYTSGDFSGYGGLSDGTQNYIKTTTQLEHGNSGGASYGPTGKFIGIPTMVVAGNLNSLSYILSVNSIKKWLSNILGNDYNSEIVNNKSIVVEQPVKNLNSDITPPDISKYKSQWGWDTFFYYDLYDESNKVVTTAGRIDNKATKTGISNRISLFTSYSGDKTWDSTMGYDVVENESGLYSAFYRYSNTLSGLNSKAYTEQIFEFASRTPVTPIIELPDIEGVYYISVKLKDKAGNISNDYILTYTYLKEHYKKLKTLNFYSDKNYKNLLASHDMKFQFDGFDYLRCVTKLDTVYTQWEYTDSGKYLGYTARSFPADMYALNSSDTVNNKNLTLITGNKFSIHNISKSINDDHVVNLKICKDGSCNLSGKVTSLLLKPISNDDYFLEGKNTVAKFHYDPNFNQDFTCGYPNLKNNSSFNNIGEPNYYLLVESKSNSVNTTSNKLNGRILLQVEEHGEAWYVNPKNGERYYMANGEEAYKIMRFLGVGITNVNLNKIKTDINFAKKNSGKIFLQVEAHGEAYYIDVDGVAHYLKDGSAAYDVMRDLGLGITNNDLNKIPAGNL